MKFFSSTLLVISLVSIPLTAIDKQAHIEGKFFPKLSDYRFFKDLTNQFQQIKSYLMNFKVIFFLITLINKDLYTFRLE